MSGQSNNGTLTNMDPATDWVDGKIGQALQFDGSNDYVNVGDPSNGSLDFGTNSFSFGMWFSSSDLNALSLNKMAAASSNAGYDVLVGADGVAGSIRGRINDSVGSVINSSTWTGTNDGGWHHVFVVVDRDAQELRLYGDGVHQGSAVSISTEGSVSSGTSLNIAARNGGANYEGTIDDVRIYNRVLSAGEVRRLYNIGQAKHPTIGGTPGSVTDGLVGHWSFDGGVTGPTYTEDLSMSGNNGTIIGGALPTIGKTGQALDFDGSDDYIDAGSGNSLAFTSDFTVSAWIKPDTFGDSSFGRIIDRQALSGAPGYSFYVNNNPGGTPAGTQTLSANINAVSGSGNADIITLGIWQHAVVRKNGTAVSFYVDGTYQGGFTSDATINDSGTSFKLGDRYDLARSFDGLLDDVRVYNRALSPEEIARLANVGRAQTASSFTNRLTDGLVGRWSFDGDVTGPTYTEDTSGNGNDGTIVGGAIPVIGKIGQALQFDSVDDYIDTAFSPSTLAPSQMTACLWAKPLRAFNSSQGDWLMHTAAGSSFFQMGHHTDNQLYFGFGNGRVIVSASATNWVQNQWQYYCMTWDGLTVTALRNGSVIGTPTARTVNSSNTELRFGIQALAAVHFSGSLDDVRIYNRALSPDEVKALYNMGQ
jgi:hypothetical protein